MQILKRAATIALGSRAYSRFATLCEQRDRSTQRLRVLTYHRIARGHELHDFYPGSISATESDFEQQMQFLVQSYRVVSMRQVRLAFQDRVELPPRAVLLTFDDAYSDFSDTAWPILRRLNLPVTLFVPTGFPDQPDGCFWWDRLHQACCRTERRNDLETPAGRFRMDTTADRLRASRALNAHVKSLPHQAAMRWIEETCAELAAPPPHNPVLGWNELRRLEGEGVTLAPHTRTHPLMTRIDLDLAYAEAVDSLADLRSRVGQASPVFAYPAGFQNDAVVRRLEHDFELAFTTRSGINDLRTSNRLELRRINVGRKTTLGVFRSRLMAWYG